MATKGKVLKTSVKLDAKQALKTLEQLEKKMTAIQKAINNTSKTSNGLTKVIKQQTTTVNRSTQAANKNAVATDRMANSNRKASSSVSLLTKNLRRLASAYVGVMGVSAVVNSSDTITSAQNKLNALDGGSPQQTDVAMQKMYAASQRARTGYGDMMSNVAKSMTLAGESFNDNIDNAIRFQEIMGKAYTLSGSSAAEISSSMYQMIQALGSGRLQGDELRSVREGATMAYKEIEKFAQELYNTDESLKDLASDGKITSDIVVAAILDAGDRIEKKFNETAMTFGQALTIVKNAALNSFTPVLKMLNSMLNSDFGRGVINGIGYALQFVAKILTVVFTWIANIYNFVADNWSVISRVILTIATVIGIALIPKFIAWIQYLLYVVYYYTYLATVAVASAIKTAIAWLAVNWQLAIILLILAAIVIAIIWVSDSFVDACGIVVGSLFWLWEVFKNIFKWMGNVAIGLWESIKAIGTNIGIAFQNCWNSAKSAFWGFIADCLDGLKGLEPVINAVAKAFGADGFTLSGLADNVRAKADSYTQLDYVSVGDAWSKGFDTFEYGNLSEAYSKGYNIGASVGTWVTDKLTGLTDSFSFDKITDVVGGQMPEDIGDIAANTGDIADGLELAQEDLEYLRKLAELEWKKEYTSNTITVDMSNYNTINGESDLDGIVTKLTDKLYEELEFFADGVYA